MSRRVVTLGAGTGQATLLRALGRLGIEPAAVVGVTDNGGSSALVRRALGLPQPGDTRACLAALAPSSPLRALLEHRFSGGELRGLSLGNLVLAALAERTGGLPAAAAELGRLLGCAGRVLPVSAASTQVGALLEDGRRIAGEWEIIRREPRTAIREMYLAGPAPADRAALEALAAAERLVVGPGSLRTGIAAILLFPGVREAIAASRARRVGIVNLATQPGQTDGLSASDHVREIERYLGTPLDAVVVNGEPFPETLRVRLAALGSEPVRDDLARDPRAVRAPLLGPGSAPRPDHVPLPTHDPERLASVLGRLLA